MEPEGPIRDYFYVEAVTPGPMYFFVSYKFKGLISSLEYSHNGRRWINLNISGVNKGFFIGNLQAGQRIYLRGIASAYATGSRYNEGCHFTHADVEQSSGKSNMKIGGNIMSLLYKNDFESRTSVPNYAFTNLFSVGVNSAYMGGSWWVTDITDLRLPATTLGEFCYYQMFFNNKIRIIPENLLPATTLASYCYSGMFSLFSGEQGVSVQLPSNLLPARALAPSCYTSMFANNRGIVALPSGFLPATTLASYCYSNMFQGCENLTTLPPKLLPATEALPYCYADMFYGCTNLTQLPKNLILATTMGISSCYEMFRRSGVTSIPKGFLKATTLTTTCYSCMFYDCKSLSHVPGKLLPAEITARECYYYMFYGCTALKTIPANLILANTLEVQSCHSMFASSGVTTIPEGFLGRVTTVSDKSCEGMFINCKSLTSIPNNLLKAKVTAPNCYSSMFSGCTALTTLPADLILATEYAREACSFMFNRSGITSIPANFIKATNYTGDSCCFNMFSDCTNLIDISKDMFAYSVHPTTGQNITVSLRCFARMFGGCTALTTLDKELLKYTSLGGHCYYGMFEGCTSLINTPDFPASIVGMASYMEMFSNCTSLTTLGDLNATTFDSNSCKQMFKGCTSLTSVPTDWLPEDEVDGSQITYKVTLNNGYCFVGMFQGCTNLIQAPNLNIYRLAGHCYELMFDGCTSLVTPPQMASVVQLADYCYQYMFQNCTSLTSTPELGNITLARACYSGMFKGCCSLTVTPNLPATTLTQDCYTEMFRDCYKASEGNNPAKGLTTITPNTNIGESNAELYFALCNAASCRDMFNGCKLLSVVPKIHIARFESGSSSTISGHCSSMFMNCEGLTSINLLIEAPIIAARALQGMFQGCKNLSSVNNDMLLNPNITAFENYACADMFSGCYSLENTIIFPVNIAFGHGNLAGEYVFSGMYQNCYISADANNGVEKGLVHISKNQGDTYPIFKGGDKSYTYQNTFNGCKLLIDAPIIYFGGSNIRMGAYVCYAMFKDCTSLESVPTQMIIASKASNYCCASMFEGCTSLVNPPVLPFILEDFYGTNPRNSISGVFNSMFKNCKSLVNPPVFSTKTGHICGVSTFTEMFSGCTSLSEAPEISFTVAGRFICDKTFDGCTSLVDASNFKFLGFETTGSSEWPDNANMVFEYTFRNCTNLETPMTFDVGPYDIDFKITNNMFQSTFSGCAKLRRTPNLTNIIIYNGNAMFKGCTSLTSIIGNPVFKRFTHSMFENCSSLEDASNITINEGSTYNGMFRNCTSLTKPPVFVANTVAGQAYQEMFRGCTSLVNPPELPATTLESNCYTSMFRGCTSLIEAPELPATTLQYACYNAMFYDCSSLEVAPDLLSEVGATACYAEMFRGCTKLKYIHCMLDNLNVSFTSSWVVGVNTGSLGLFKCKSGTEEAWRGLGTNSGIPSGWTVQQV